METEPPLGNSRVGKEQRIMMGAVMLQPVLRFAQDVVARVLEEGDAVIDATAGNGHDTLFLAEQIGSTGEVYAFDLQNEALAATRQRLVAARFAGSLQLFQHGHERMEDVLPGALHGAVRAVMFNLGYLPGGDKAVVTRPATTLPALQAALRLLAPGGLATVVCYTGHEGGRAEADAVAEWAAALDQQHYHALCYRFLNQQNRPPHLIAIEKHTI